MISRKVVGTIKKRDGEYTETVQRFRSRGLGAQRGLARRSIRRAQWRVWHSRTRVAPQPLPPSLPLAAARCLTWRPLSFSLLFAPQSRGSLHLHSPTLLAFCSLTPSLEIPVSRSSFRALFFFYLRGDAARI